MELGGNVSPMTGERPAAWLLTNTSPNPCSLYGFPQVDLFAADGATVPFSYTHTSPYIRWPTPTRLVLAPGGAPALLWVSKSRCDRGDESVAVRVRVHLEAGYVTGPVGNSSLAYCVGGPQDPGQTVSVNPFVAAS